MKLSFCVAHNRQCPIDPLSAFKLIRKVGVEQALTQLRLEPKRKTCVGSPPWWTSIDQADGLDSVDPLTVHISGITCKDDSPLGHQRGKAGLSRKEHATFLATRLGRSKTCAERVYFTECAVAYSAKDRQRKLSKSHMIIQVETGPELQSFPTVRLRSFGSFVDSPAHGGSWGSWFLVLIL